MSDWVYVAAAYGLTWLVLVGYGVYLNRRLRHAEASLARLEGEGYR